MTNYLLAGGGTGGHVNPLLALAEHIRESEPDAHIVALGTAEGLESRLVPERNFQLLTIQRLPFPRKLNSSALKFPRRFLSAAKSVKQMLKDHQIDVVVGFGGYASAPAYWAAIQSGVPFVIHEANALPGLANRLGARFAAAVGVCFENTRLPKAKVVGMPLRPEIAALNALEVKVKAQKAFGLGDGTTLLVTGGSLGARRINQTIAACQSAINGVGVQILHIVGDASELEPISSPNLVRIKYCDQMDLAIAAADFAVARAGASTVAEFSAVGLPAVYVPYPVGNGEQRFNLSQVVGAGGAISVEDSAFTEKYVNDVLIPLLQNSETMKTMSSRASSVGIRDGANRLYQLVRGVLK